MTSLSHKIKCLGKKHNLEGERHHNMMALGEIGVIGFDNFEIYRDSVHAAQYNAFLTWVQENHNSTFYDQLIRNTQSASKIVDTARDVNILLSTKYKEARQIAEQAADGAINADDRANLLAAYNAIRTAMDRTVANTYWNEHHVFSSGGFTFQFYLDGDQSPSGSSTVNFSTGDHNSTTGLALTVASTWTQTQAKNEIQKLDNALDKLQGYLGIMDSTFSDYTVTGTNLQNKKNVVNSGLELKRKEAKIILESKIQIISNQIEYLQVCIKSASS